MKTLFLSVCTFIIFTFSTQAQEGELIPKNAIGIRFSEGSNLGLGIAISYQHQMFGDNNRVELNLGTQTGLAYDYANLYDVNAYYHWVFGIIDNLNWYAGPGVGVQFVSFGDYDIDTQINPFIGIEGGAEYRFDFPMQVSLSVRPSYIFSKEEDYDYGYYGGLYDNNVNVTVGVGVRYIF